MNLGDTGELSYNWDERTRKYNPRRTKLEAHSGAVFQIKSCFAESKACWFCLLFFGNAHHCLLLWNSYPSPRQLSYVALQLLLATSFIFLFCRETFFSQGGHIPNPCPVFFPFVLACFVYSVTRGLTVDIKTCLFSTFLLFIKADVTWVWDRVIFFSVNFTFSTDLYNVPI